MVYFCAENGMLNKLSDSAQLSEQNDLVGFLTLDDFARGYQQFGFPKVCYDACVSADSRYHSIMEVYDGYSYGILHLLDLNHIHHPRKRAAFFLKPHLFLFVAIDSECVISEDMFCKMAERVGGKLTVERALSYVLMHLIGGSNDILQRHEQRIIEAEKEILNDHVEKQMNQQIFEMKNGLMIRKAYYEELIDFAETVLDDENSLFSDEENFRYLKVFIDKAKRLSDSTQLLCDNLMHVREMYQAAMDYRLNNIMKVFTVVTTIFLPLSLIAGWYGMNFDMPEFTWQYGYPAVVLISVAVVAFCIWFFRRKKFF